MNENILSTWKSIKMACRRIYALCKKIRSQFTKERAVSTGQKLSLQASQVAEGISVSKVKSFFGRRIILICLTTAILLNIGIKLFKGRRFPGDFTPTGNIYISCGMVLGLMVLLALFLHFRGKGKKIVKELGDKLIPHGDKKLDKSIIGPMIGTIGLLILGFIYQGKFWWLPVWWLPLAAGLALYFSRNLLKSVLELKVVAALLWIIVVALGVPVLVTSGTLLSDGTLGKIAMKNIEEKYPDIKFGQPTAPITSLPHQVKWKLLAGQPAFASGVSEAELEAEIQRLEPGVLTFREWVKDDPSTYSVFSGWNAEGGYDRFEGVWALVTPTNRHLATNVLGTWEVTRMENNTFAGTRQTGQDGLDRRVRIASFTLKPK